MANIFEFTLKKRERDAGLDKETPSDKKSESTESIKPAETMTQGDFSYGSEGYRRKPKPVPPRSMQ